MKRLILMLLVAPAAAYAQDAQRVRVNVDYVAGTSIYLSAGEGQGLVARDTVNVYRPGVAAKQGRLVIESSTRARSVARIAGDTFAVARGDVLLLELSEAARARVLLAGRTPDGQIADTTRAPARAPVSRAPPAPGGARVYGRLGFDFGAARTTAHWGADDAQHSTTTYGAPVARFRMIAENLPGNFRFNTNLRASYIDGEGLLGRPLAVDVYQASIETELTHQPLRFAAGRFYNPYESHSGYWDGALIRVGRSKLGAGAVFGYEPDRATQSFSTTSPKASVFIDAHDQGGKVRYDGDLSFHYQPHSWLGTRREYMGITQRVSVGRVFLTQRARAGRVDAGNVDLWDMQLSGSMPLAGALQLNARYSMERNDLYMTGPAAAGTRVRWSGGVSAAGSAGYFNLEAGTNTTGYGPRGQSLTGSLALTRIPGAMAFALTGSYSSDDTFKSSYISPSLERLFRRGRIRAAGSYYHTDYGSALYEQLGGELTLGWQLPARSEIVATASALQGSGTTVNRVLLSMWKSF